MDKDSHICIIYHDEKKHTSSSAHLGIQKGIGSYYRRQRIADNREIISLPGRNCCLSYPAVMQGRSWLPYQMLPMHCLPVLSLHLW